MKNPHIYFESGKAKVVDMPKLYPLCDAAYICAEYIPDKKLKYCGCRMSYEIRVKEAIANAVEFDDREMVVDLIVRRDYPGYVKYLGSVHTSTIIETLDWDKAHPIPDGYRVEIGFKWFDNNMGTSGNIRTAKLIKI